MGESDSDRLARRREQIVAKESLLWGDDVGVAYHEAASKDMDRHWDEVVWPVLSAQEIDYTRTVDFACGRGRNTEKLCDLATSITMVDVNPENIDYCREKFANCPQIDFALCNGYELTGIADDSVTFLYSFDSMVHFDLELIISYLYEFERVLRPGGTAFIHHSNYTGSPGADFQQNPHWRNFMSADLFRHVATRAGLEVVRQDVIGWGGVSQLDCLTLCVART